MQIPRRRLLSFFVASLLAPSVLAHNGPHHHHHRHPHRVRVRRRVWRRRIRRHVAWHVIGARRLLVVPLAVAVGWELFVDNKVVVVKEVHRHKVVVEHVDGKTETIEVVKQDTPENTKSHEGSKYETEEEVEEGAKDGK